MRVPEEPVCIDLFRQNPVFTSLHLKYPVRVVPPLIVTADTETMMQGVQNGAKCTLTLAELPYWLSSHSWAGWARIFCFAYPAKFAKFCIAKLGNLIFASSFAKLLIDRQSFIHTIGGEKAGMIG
jgi:hypothetical protein